MRELGAAAAFVMGVVAAAVVIGLGLGVIASTALRVICALT